MTEDYSHIEPLTTPEWERPTPGLFWARWLAGAKENGPGLRRWQVWIWWTGQRGVLRKLRATVILARGFIEAPLEAWGGVRRFGERARELYGVSPATQYRQLLKLRWLHGIRPVWYYRFQLFLPERQPFAEQFVPQVGPFLQVIHRQLPLKGDEEIFLSKEAFRLWCKQQSIPTVDNLLQVTDGEVIARSTESLPPCDLFVKPTNWRQGKGASRWQCVRAAEGHYYTNTSGVRLGANEMEKFVCKTSREQGRPYIVQRALANHRDLLNYTNGALSTIRLMTVRETGKAAKPLMAALRMPTGDAVVDNFDTGCVAAPIELDTGTCGPGLSIKEGLPPEVLHTHPETGAKIAELTLPFWSECLALTCRAHDHIKTQVPVIGWDVAILDDGPIIVEANHLPGQDVAQMPGGFPLGNSAFAEVVVAQLRKMFLERSS